MRLSPSLSSGVARSPADQSENIQSKPVIMNFRIFCGSLLALVATQAFGVEQPAVVFEIDPTVKHQVIEGFGTCIATWIPDIVARYREDDFVEFYLNTLGASA